RPRPSHSHREAWNPGKIRPVSRRSRCDWTLPLSVPCFPWVPSNSQLDGCTVLGYLSDLPYVPELGGAVIDPNTSEPRPYTCYHDALRSPHQLPPYDHSATAYLPNPQFTYDAGDPMEPSSNCPPAPVPISSLFLYFGPCIHCRFGTLLPCAAVRDTNGSKSTQCSGKPQSSHVDKAFLVEPPDIQSFEEIVLHLNKRGCPDLTDEMDPASYSHAPVNGGGLGDIYKGELKNGTAVAIKVIRSASNPLDEAVQKHLKASP
ncbi:hypothetical protein FRC12_017486, partial [Ceratobasidium sp. 428]